MASEATRMPGRVATFETCSRTLSSIARTSASLANRMPGTRIFPRGSTTHSNSERRFRRDRSTVPLRSDVDHALRDPRPALSRHTQARPGRALDLDRGVVARDLHRLAEGASGEPRAVHFHLVA